jgi:hypothetical protein
MISFVSAVNGAGETSRNEFVKDDYLLSPE